MTRIGVVLVHFHTPELACLAVPDLVEDAAHSGLDLDLVLVDNGSTPEARRQLESLDAVRVIDAGGNLGYAGAFNLGAAALESAEVLVVMNPDVRVLSGCLASLVEALGTGAGVAGPRFWWDRPGGFLLPPTEERGRAQSVRRFLAPRLGPGPARLRWRRHARRHWLASEPLASHALSGALLAIDKVAWRHIGPFDEAYALYFEETDWLERARCRGVTGVYVPAAEALHAYAQSTAKQPRSAAWFADSHRRFRRLHYGRLFAGTLESAARIWPEKTSDVVFGRPTPDELEAADWLEVAASPLGFPAAARYLEAADPKLPEGRYWLRGLRGDEELWSRELGGGS